jgi:hypothetical protein
MKILILGLIFSALFSPVKADDESFVCLMTNAQPIYNYYDSMEVNDKFKHCSASCELAIKCGSYSSMSVGVFKEIWDLFGPGNADINDIAADYYGIDLFKKRKAFDRKSCQLHCGQKYTFGQ